MSMDTRIPVPVPLLARGASATVWYAVGRPQTVASAYTVGRYEGRSTRRSYVLAL
jgi:hypothetical protein